MIAALQSAIAAATAMKPRAFQDAKWRPRSDPRLVYAIHDVGCATGRLIAVDRKYCVIGGGPGFDYAAPRFAHLHVADAPAVRALAKHVTEVGYAGRGPIYYVLSDDDDRATYCARLLALLDVVRGQR